MEISTRNSGPVWILECRGKLALDRGAEIFRSAAQAALEEGHRWLLIDLSQVGLIDSTGLGALVSRLVSARRRGGEMALLCPSTRVSDVLEITDTHRLFQIYSDEQEAVRSLSAAAERPGLQREG